MNKDIFRQYDIRGIVGQNLISSDVQHIGYNFSQFLKKNNQSKVAIGRDIRESSEDFTIALTEGLLQGGVNVIDFGVLTTPMLYYATIKKKIKNAVMITASHNTKEFNGLKFLMNNKPIFARKLLNLYDSNPLFIVKDKSGTYSKDNIFNEYLSEILSKFDFSNITKPLKVIIDPGNGTTALFLKEITSNIPGIYSFINNVPNGSFPNRDPDPSKPKNLIDLYKKISNDNLELGIAFDCDGDRISIMDNHGNLIRGDQILYLLTTQENNSNINIVIDSKASNKITEVLSKLGYNVIISRTGNPYIKAEMLKNNAFIGGELSGHIIYSEWFNIDDAFFAMLKLINIISQKGIEVLNTVPELFRIHDFQITCSNIDKKKFLSQIKRYLKKIKIDYEKININEGIKIQNENGIIIYRIANTEDIITISIEGYKKEDIIELKKLANYIFIGIKTNIVIA